MSTVQERTKAKDETRNDWETPDDLFAALSEEFHFQLDVAANSRNTKCPIYYGPGSGLAKDGLRAPWDMTWWCNPPFNAIADWVASARGETIRHRRRGVMLLPANRTEQPFWHEHVVPSIGDGICQIRWIRGRLTFKGAPSTAPFPCLLLIWGRQ